MKGMFLQNIPASIAVIGLVGYFFGMAVVFIVNPVKNAESFSVKPVDNAGKTEIRVYYGGISFALGAFLLYLTLALLYIRRFIRLSADCFLQLPFLLQEQYSFL